MKENQYIELKSRFNDEVIETLTAFANTKGGKVLVGVYDNGIAVADFTIGKETVQKYLNEIKNKTQPSIIPSADIIHYQGKSVIEFSIPEFPVKPVSFKGRYFKRVQNSNHQLSAVEISDIYMQSIQYSWDSYPYAKAGMASLNIEKIKNFISKVNAIGRFHLSDKPEEALQKLRMLHDGVPTNAAMILFSKENLLHNVHIGRFKTPSLIIADKMINGNLYDVAQESMQTIIGHLKFAFEITGKTTQRTEIPEYPLDAIRETLFNCLIHRDYRNPSDILIKIYDQQIVFYSPGGLYGDITEKELHTDVYRASIRNKQLAEAFYLTHDIEKYGSGFIRIRKAIADYPTMVFEFRNLGDCFETKFSYTEQRVGIGQNISESVEKEPENGSESGHQNGPEKGHLNGPEKGPLNGPEKGPLNGREKGPQNGPEKGPQNGHEKGPLNRPEKGPLNRPEKGPQNGPEKGPLNRPEKGPLNRPEKGPQNGTAKGPQKSYSVTVSQQKIIKSIENNPFITREELVKIVGISLSKIKENISKLKAKGILKRIGASKNGYWKINDK